MAISVATPKNLNKIKPKFVGSFTKRQVFSLGAAALVGLPTYFFLKDAAGTDAAAIGMVMVMLPILSFIKEDFKYGLPAEKLLYLFIRHNRTTPIRPYKAENLFTRLEEREKIKKEVLYLEEKARRAKKGSSGKSKGK